MTAMLEGFYKTSKFDQTTIRALATNACMLERAQQNRIDPSDRASISFNIQISANSYNDSTTIIPLARVCEEQWKAKYSTPMPAHGYIQEIRMGSYRNRSDKSMVLRYNGDDVLGSFVHPMNTDQDAELGCALWVAEADHSASFDGPGKLLHTANSFVRSDAFAKYNSLLSSNFEDAAVYVQDGRYVQYQSPCRYLLESTHLAEGCAPDLVASMIGANEDAFTSNVYTSSFIEDQLPGSAVAFKMIANDWESLCRSVKENVESPLQLNTYDMTTGAKLNFAFAPIRAQCMNADGEATESDPQWDCGDMAGHKKHDVSAVLTVSIAFA